MFEEAGILVDLAPSELKCPFGTFPTRLTWDRKPVAFLSRSTRRLPTQGLLTTFDHPVFCAQLLLGAVVPRLPVGMTVLGCSAGVWRLRTATPVNNLAFECFWADPIRGEALAGYCRSAVPFGTVHVREPQPEHLPSQLLQAVEIVVTLACVQLELKVILDVTVKFGQVPWSALAV